MAVATPMLQTRRKPCQRGAVQYGRTRTSRSPTGMSVHSSEAVMLTLRDNEKASWDRWQTLNSSWRFRCAAKIGRLPEAERTYHGPRRADSRVTLKLRTRNHELGREIDATSMLAMRQRSTPEGPRPARRRRGARSHGRTDARKSVPRPAAGGRKKAVV